MRVEFWTDDPDDEESDEGGTVMVWAYAPHIPAIGDDIKGVARDREWKVVHRFWETPYSVTLTVE